MPTFMLRRGDENPPPKSSAKSTLLGNALEMNLREDMGEIEPCSWFGMRVNPETLPEGHTRFRVVGGGQLGLLRHPASASLLMKQEYFDLL